MATYGEAEVTAATATVPIIETNGSHVTITDFNIFTDTIYIDRGIKSSTLDYDDSTGDIIFTLLNGNQTVIIENMVLAELAAMNFTIEEKSLANDILPKLSSSVNLLRKYLANLYEDTTAASIVATGLDTTQAIPTTFTGSQMKETGLLALAATVSFITEAHLGQKFGQMPYAFHAIQVSQMAVQFVNDYHPECKITAETAGTVVSDPWLLEKVQMIALLHDVIEMTPFNESALRERFSAPIVDAVVALTIADGEDYSAQLGRLIGTNDGLALVVQLADSTVLRNTGKDHLDLAESDSLNARYDTTISMVQSALRSLGYTI